MRRFVTPITLAVLAGLPASGYAAEFSNSYLEMTADLSKTENTAANPVKKDANGRLSGIAASWEVFGSFYVKGAWSRERKEFENEVARTPVNLNSNQTMTTLGAGYHLGLIKMG